MRLCENCGKKMPRWRPRTRMEDNKLICDSCKEGRPGFSKAEGALRCEECGTEMGDDGLKVVAGKLVCPNGCQKEAEVKTSDLKVECPQCHQRAYMVEDDLCENCGYSGRVESWNKNSALRTAEAVLGIKLAHDSGDSKKIWHCPFCGAGQVLGRSDGTAECQFCKTFFTVQVQPEYPNFPQTNPETGEPFKIPGMPGGPHSPGAPKPDGEGLPEEELPPGEEPDKKNLPPWLQDGQKPEQAEKPKKKNLPPWLKDKKSSVRYYVTSDGVALPEDKFIAHLAIKHAADRAGVIDQVRAGRITNG